MFELRSTQAKLNNDEATRPNRIVNEMLRCLKCGQDQGKSNLNIRQRWNNGMS